MNIIVVYVFPTSGQYDAYANRFCSGYRAFDPGHNHQLLVICNGENPSEAQKAIFDGLKPLFIQHDNVGWDIGAYQMISHEVDCDFMVCFGASTYFKRGEWLSRMLEAFIRNGPYHLYGATGNTGNLDVMVWPHIRTTAFWFRPELLRAYPYQIITQRDRYYFEHGPLNFSRFIEAENRQCYVVHWDHIVPLTKSNTIRNGYCNGDQSQLLARDRCTEQFNP